EGRVVALGHDLLPQHAAGGGLQADGFGGQRGHPLQDLLQRLGWRQGCLAQVDTSSATTRKPPTGGGVPPLETATAQYLNSGILPNGSSAALVRMFAAAS